MTESAFGNPFLFSGREWDPELGFYYFRNRYMDPGLGRFVSRDPLGLWGDPLNLGNGYTYAASNPWSLVDPFGLCGGNIVERFLSWAKAKLIGWADGRYEDILERARSSDTQVEGGIDYNRLIDGSAENFSSADVLGDAISQAQEEGTEGAMEAGKFVLKEGVLQAVGGGIGKLGKLGKVVDDIDPRSAKRLDNVVDAEVAAQEALTALQGSIKGGHFLTRHSPATTLEQQYLRATKGILPDGTQSYKTDASRFFGYTDMQGAIDKATRSYIAAGQPQGRYSVVIDMGREIGEGYLKGGGTYVRSHRALVNFNEFGQPYTAYPLLR